MSLFDILLPKECIFCSKVGRHICEKCLRDIPRSLPLCLVCGRISTKGYTHSSCTKLNVRIQYFKGWNIENKAVFDSQIEVGFYSPFLEMIGNTLERSNLKEQDIGAKIFPLKNTSREKRELNRYLSKKIRGSKKDTITYIGIEVIDSKELLKEITLLENKYKNIQVISLL